ncbi:MAG TPA: sulfotransferase domain-containing protein [Thermoanaerobaculia bacterium]|nr:sulfotransferase domain-containing protein [Thermoanaerobaculia bacterium]
MDHQPRNIARTSLELLIFLARQAQMALRGFSNLLSHRHAVRYLYRPREDDLFIVSYPKSGTTLMQMMLYQMTSEGSMEIPHIDCVAPWIELWLLRDRADVLESLPSPRFFKSHLLYDQIPKGRKIIYLVRDVRDVAVSSYHHFCLVTGKQPPLDQYIDGFLQGKSPLFGSWFEHTRSWLPHRNDSNVLLLKYEDIISDLPGTVQAVSQFWGVPVAPEDLPRILERCGINFMRQHNSKFDPRLESQMDWLGREFIRKGTQGEGRSVFSPEQNKTLSHRLEKLAGKLGSSKGDDLSQILWPDLELGGADSRLEGLSHGQERR